MAVNFRKLQAPLPDQSPRAGIEAIEDRQELAVLKRAVSPYTFVVKDTGDEGDPAGC